MVRFSPWLSTTGENPELTSVRTLVPARTNWINCSLQINSKKFIERELAVSQCGNYKKLLLSFFWQIFRETYVFTKKLNKLIWQENVEFSVISCSARRAQYECGKMKKLLVMVTEKKFVKLTLLVTSLINTLFSRNFCQRCVVTVNLHVQCLTSSPANFAWNFQIHFSLEPDGEFQQNQFLLKA